MGSCSSSRKKSLSEESTVGDLAETTVPWPARDSSRYARAAHPPVRHQSEA
jgi:hypothetical protein